LQLSMHGQICFSSSQTVQEKEDVAQKGPNCMKQKQSRRARIREQGGVKKARLVARELNRTFGPAGFADSKYERNLAAFTFSREPVRKI
jgi:hypothetical protein